MKRDLANFEQNCRIQFVAMKTFREVIEPKL
jgi:hypothetical protein